HPNLPPERRPVEEERRARVRLELATLARRVVRVEDEASLVEALEQHHADRWRSVRRRSRERRRLGCLDGGARLCEPDAELLERIGGEVAAPELAHSLEPRAKLRRAQDLAAELDVGGHELPHD